MSRSPFLIAGLLALATALPAVAGDQSDVRGLVRAGEILPLEEILRAVKPQVAGTYVGADFDSETFIYRLRFMRDGDVFNVDVDARTGRRLSRGHY